jgi:hypothetical protein
MRSFHYAVLLAVVVLQPELSSAANPECEEFTAEQPNSMATDVLLTYAWDAECGDDPEIGPLSRDGEEIIVEWSHNLDSEPHEHTASDSGSSPGVHQYELVVMPSGEDSYVVDDTVMVSGTEPADDDDAETDQPEEDSGVSDTESSDSGGCVIAAVSTLRISLLEVLVRLM